MISLTKNKPNMSLNKNQVELITAIFGALDIEVPEFSKGVSDILKAFKAFSKKDSKKPAKKVKDPNAPKKPVNTYFAWLALNRAGLKSKNGDSEDGLNDLLKGEYEKFKKTSAFQKMQKECEEKMKVYKDEMKDYSSEDSASDDDKAPKKAKKAPKSDDEKQPPNVYMTYRHQHLESIKTGLKEGENLAEVLKEKYEEFKKTKEYNALQEKCKADFAKWKEEKSGSDSEVAPKKATKTSTKESAKESAKESTKESAKDSTKDSTKTSKKVKKPVDSDSDSDDDTFTMPKEVPKEEKKTKKTAKKAKNDDEE